VFAIARRSVADHWIGGGLSFAKLRLAADSIAACDGLGFAPWSNQAPNFSSLLHNNFSLVKFTKE